MARKSPVRRTRYIKYNCGGVKFQINAATYSNIAVGTVPVALVPERYITPKMYNEQRRVLTRVFRWKKKSYDYYRHYVISHSFIPRPFLQQYSPGGTCNFLTGGLTNNRIRVYIQHDITENDRYTFMILYERVDTHAL